MIKNKKFTNSRNFQNVRIWGVPVGKFLFKKTSVATDEVTKEGVDKLTQTLRDEKNGVVVAFAHLGIFDVFGTAMVLEKMFQFKAVFPVAASWYYFPVLNYFFRILHKQLQHKIIPVFRKEEFGYTKVRSKIGTKIFLDFSGLDNKQKKQANKHYSDQAQQALKNNGLVMLAPYGGRAPYQEYLRSGVVSLLRAGRPTILTFTSWNWKHGYVVYFSKVLKFSQKVSKEEIHEIIYAEYLRMAKLAGVTEKEMLESKTGSIIVDILWNSFAKIISFIR